MNHDRAWSGDSIPIPANTGRATQRASSWTSRSWSHGRRFLLLKQEQTSPDPPGQLTKDKGFMKCERPKASNPQTVDKEVVAVVERRHSERMKSRASHIPRVWPRLLATPSNCLNGPSMLCRLLASINILALSAASVSRIRIQMSCHIVPFVFSCLTMPETASSAFALPLLQRPQHEQIATDPHTRTIANS
jgi:hypothetical protein